MKRLVKRAARRPRKRWPSCKPLLAKWGRKVRAEGEWYRLPLLPRYGLCLTVSAEAAALFARYPVLKEKDPALAFALLFRKVWRVLPLGVRRAILKHWEERLPDVCLAEGRMDEGTGATCGNGGYSLYFRPYYGLLAVDGMPRMAYVIAHELAHVYQLTQKPEAMVAGALDAAIYEANEQEVDALAASWGFPKPVA